MGCYGNSSLHGPFQIIYSDNWNDLQKGFESATFSG